MSNLNMNKAAAAILVAGLIGMITGKVTDTLYYGSPEGRHALAHDAKRGYQIEVVEAPADGSPAPTGPGDLSALYATADVAAGEAYVNKKCTTCHDVTKGGANKVGPHLWSVVNRQVAGVSDFNYSSGMKDHVAKSKTWSLDSMNEFLWSPPKSVPGTMMSFAGISKDQERANVIAYMATKMTDSPVKLPTASAKPAAKDAAPAKK
jgi:cytochrome c